MPIGEEGYKGIRQTMLGFYMQDDFKMSSRLTLNMGLRWETTTDPRESHHQISNLLDIRDAKETVYPAIDAFFKTKDLNFQPRFGFAWQTNSKATRVVRGGFGIYHDLIVPFAFNQQTSKYPLSSIACGHVTQVPWPRPSQMLRLCSISRTSPPSRWSR